MPVNDGRAEPPQHSKLRGRSADIPGIRGLDHSILDLRRRGVAPDMGWIYVGTIGDVSDNTPDGLLNADVSPPFEDGFINPSDIDPSALTSFYMDAAGVVWLRGKPTPPGDLPATCFHLPEGFRPAASHYFVGAGPSEWRIDSDGAVVLLSVG